MMIKRFVDWFFASNKEKKVIVNCADEFIGSKFTLLDLIQSLETRVEYLEEKYKGALTDIRRLEQENIETTNALYEFENRILSKLDAHLPPIYNMDEYTLGDK
jgi:hypothetical protein